MRIIGCDLDARQQTVAMLDTKAGEVVKMTLTHEGDNVREFYSTLPHPVIGLLLLAVNGILRTNGLRTNGGIRTKVEPSI